MIVTGYIHRFHVTDEYIVTLVGTQFKFVGVYSSIHRRIYDIFIGLEGKFIGLNQTNESLFHVVLVLRVDCECASMPHAFKKNVPFC
jgi:hypothetical protein